MTTIVFKDGVIAADSRASSDWNIGTCQKIFTRSSDGAVFAGSGDYANVVKTARWFINGAVEKCDSKEYKAIVVYPEERIVEMLESGEQIPIQSPLEGAYAIGSGAPFAMAAMMAGADAYNAVRIACVLDPYSCCNIVTKILWQTA